MAFEVLEEEPRGVTVTATTWLNNFARKQRVFRAVRAGKFVPLLAETTVSEVKYFRSAWCYSIDVDTDRPACTLFCKTRQFVLRLLTCAFSSEISRETVLSGSEIRCAEAERLFRLGAFKLNRFDKRTDR